MRLKKGFTLAEILIVLMVIGVIATMTIPSLMKGVNESQIKTGYKKALNTIVNLTAMERISGQLPTVASGADALRLFESLNSNLSVREYATIEKSDIDSGSILDSNGYSTKITITDDSGNSQIYGAGDNNAATASTISTGGALPWIVTEDNLAYSVTLLGTTTNKRCSTKLEINGAESQTAAATVSCAVIVVDVNGLSKGPNHFDAQVSETDGALSAGMASTEKMATLTGDQYPIFVGSDGATAGPKQYTVTGRIASDLK